MYTASGKTGDFIIGVAYIDSRVTGGCYEAFLQEVSCEGSAQMVMLSCRGTIHSIENAFSENSDLFVQFDLILYRYPNEQHSVAPKLYVVSASSSGDWGRTKSHSGIRGSHRLSFVNGIIE